MAFQHKNQAGGQWQNLTLAEQLGNIGSEISRAIKWKDGDQNLYRSAIERALELFDLTIRDSRWQGRLKELARVREVLCDAVFGDNEYQTSLNNLNQYFYYFAFAARAHR